MGNESLENRDPEREKTWMELLAQDRQGRQVGELMKTNSCSQQFGLTLSREDAVLLTAERKNSLQREQRVEFGGGILPALVYAFCDSAYISQDDYVDTLIRLQEIFYLFKNEMMDEITDGELIAFMKEQFEEVCFGDADYLENTCLDIFAQVIRAGYRGYRGTGGRGEYGQFDEVKRWDKDLYLEVLRDLCWR